MVGDHLARDPVETRDGSDDPLAEPRVLADLIDVRGGQNRPLRQGGARDADHADVMEAKAERDLGVVQQLWRRGLGQLERQLRHTRAVGCGLAETLRAGSRAARVRARAPPPSARQIPERFPLQGSWMSSRDQPQNGGPFRFVRASPQKSIAHHVSRPLPHTGVSPYVIMSKHAALVGEPTPFGGSLLKARSRIL